MKAIIMSIIQVSMKAMQSAYKALVTSGTVTLEQVLFNNLNTEKLQIKGNTGLTQGSVA